ncbi:prolyl oligopeptidase family serine peptidase [Solwaraspora sp. WMMD1047]|uniref:S9 family peptidase n=1 Tax=Solwaraspora sp. WMMD1047 TaxID=3016102 RepID=UPI00241724FE|nr:prolyl oligopeptidase family serine peptidase [Solwaraspora sp. WMMD1047]MDG4829281.1 prolyl oligopeptidase family serine peptidase [Solwaraspora sp. WMMD1047]
MRPALPGDIRVGSGVYGYGSRPYAVSGRTVFFVDANDQLLYRCSPAGEVTLLAPPADELTRYAAPAPSPDGSLVYAVRERDLATGVSHDIVSVTTDGGGRIEVVASGHDFYGAPAVSPDGSRIAYVAWDHPHMPWDQSVLHELGPAGDLVVDGRPGISFTQPRYSPSGVLHVIHDESGWWNLYAADGVDGSLRPLAPMPAEFGRPDWSCGLATYAFVDGGSIVAAARDAGGDVIHRITPRGPLETLPGTAWVVEGVAGSGADVTILGGSAVQPLEVSELSRGSLRLLRDAAARRPDRISMPERLRFPTHDGSFAHAIHYEPANSAGPPPLIVSCHGGPTVGFTGLLDNGVQFWTSRGYAVVEVNYRGSAGHGRAYRQAIQQQWGHLDVADAISAARHLVAQGRVDPRRIAIRGLSSGGFTALRAAQSVPDFAAVTSLCGVVDPSSLPANTHKMESRYLDGLIAPWPAGRAEYERRSVLTNVGNLRTPTLLIHGRDDAIVPHSQSRRLAEELRHVGTPVELVTYEGEGHGLRNPDHVVDALLREHRFVERHLGSGASRSTAPPARIDTGQRGLREYDLYLRQGSG